ncbi:amino acid/amide ABC transporter membrane protein 2 (HAAT family) [Labedella gwakjiensis]|uniref:Amino acid/amide ABC transporter membrane protein 2 (HAAT family) n=1 Tax=Labedella gwakjiensis TaxID=390269 RepID=A0A2P8GWK0_9MICO|nr:branched-chain amino acid ABC transporter permease [Labedella gwakjiensis]PSL38341.1 amino acid/amide ABC transporter membrane protein 2 (HAAT family) [Labedella gwakjiensis]RUQ87126.1 branched-chain amino acid ABC transporter permease [Labedella gwakjiensis]
MSASTLETPPSAPAADTWSRLLTDRAKELAQRSQMRSRRQWITAAVITGAVFIAVPFLVNTYWLYQASILIAYSIAVMGARVLFGMAGILSLAQATFIGVGAYTAAIAASVFELIGVYELLLVIAVSIVASLVVGIPALRVSGLRLALLTLAVGELFQWWLVQGREVTGGAQGIPVATFYIPGVDTGDPLFLYALCAVFALITTAALGHLPFTQLGRNMAAVRESPFAARSVGVPVNRTKLIAFVVAGLCAGISGFLVAHTSQSVTPTNYDMFSSVYILVGVILGGTSSTFGAWLGAAYVSIVPPLFAAMNAERIYVLLSGALLVALIYVLPGGLVQLGHLAKRWIPARSRQAGGADADGAGS